MARSPRAFGGAAHSSTATDLLFRGLIHAAAAAKAAARVTAAAIDEYLSMAGLDCDKAKTAAEVAALADKVSVGDLPEAVRERVVPCLARMAARAAQAAASARRAAATPVAPMTVKDRGGRAYPVVAGRPLAPAAGVVLAGPRVLVERGLVAVRALLVDTGFRGVRLVSVPSTEQAVADPGGVTVGAPWWDSLFTAPGSFRQFFTRLEKDPRLGATADFVTADDLCRLPPRALGGSFLVRALAAYRVLAGVARARGGVMAAGLPLDNREYEQKHMAALADAVRRLDLFEERGLLYATDGSSSPYHIPEPDPSPT